MKRSYKTITVIALAASILLAGCSSNTSHRRSETEREDDNSSRVITESVEAAVGYDYGYNSAEAEYMYDDIEAPSEFSNSVSGGAGNSSTGTSTGTVTNSDLDVSDRMLIRYVTVSCETLRFTELTSDLESQVASLGGYIESKNFSGTGNAGDLRTASYTIRVSSEDLDTLVNSIGNAAVITSSNESTEDVTLSYADTQARIESLRVEQETLNNLLAQATDLDIVLQLQNELTNVRYQIESYESQLRVLENLSSYSTLTLYVTEVLEETEPEEPHIKTFSEKISDSFHEGLEDAKESWQEFVIGLAGNVIPVSVTIVLTVIALIILVIAVKKTRKKVEKKAGVQAASSEVKADNKEKKET